MNPSQLAVRIKINTFRACQKYFISVALTTDFSMFYKASEIVDLLVI